MPEIISRFEAVGEGRDGATLGKIGRAAEWETEQAKNRDDKKKLGTQHSRIEEQVVGGGEGSTQEIQHFGQRVVLT